MVLDEKYYIIISDFGFAAQLNLYSNPNSPLRSMLALISQMNLATPKIINKIKYDYKIDIFSLGLAMLWLISNRYPIKFIDNKRCIISNDIDTRKYNEYLIILIKKKWL